MAGSIMSQGSTQAFIKKLVFLACVLSLVLSPLHAFKAGAHAVLAGDIARSLPEGSLVREAMLRHPHIAAWGATGPDLPANSVGIAIDHAPWFEKYHYERVGSFARRLLEVALAEGNYQQIAWAAGWLSHVVGDLWCHGVFVNPDPEVGGVYLANPDTKEMHGFLESYADKVLFTDKSNPRRSYNVQHMQETFADFDAGPIAALMAEASSTVYGGSPSLENIEGWKKFFKNIYLNTGMAGETNWVYNNTYEEARDHLLDEAGMLWSGHWAGMTRLQRLEHAYGEALSMTVRLLGEAERRNFLGFSDAWNLDAFHMDGRSIGTLTVTIRTADVSAAGTDDDVWFALVRDDGRIWRSPVLDKGSGLFGLGGMLVNDFERGSVETYYLFVEGSEFPINRIREVFIEKDTDGISGGWKLGSVTVTINGVVYFDGAIDTWLEDDDLRWTGTVTRVPPQRIPVHMELDADVIADRITLTTCIASTGRPPYRGPAVIAIQHGDGTVDTHPVIVGGDGSVHTAVSLSPEDRVQAHVYRVREEDARQLYVGQTEWLVPDIPYEDIAIRADAFNDVVSGTIGGSYSGPVEILVRDTEEAADDRNYRIRANDGVFSLAVPLTGSDAVAAWSFCEGVRLPRGDYLVKPDLGSLVIACGHTTHDELVGTISNTGKPSAGAYRGDVYIARPGSDEVVGISRTYATQTVAKPEVGRSIAGLRNTQASSESEFSFLAVPIVLDLGYSVWIEHEGLQKYFTYDPTEGVSQQAREPVSLAAASPLSGIINPVVNPVSHMGSLERANVGQGMQGASSSAASPMQMMAPAAGTFVWEGAWDTSNGPMILEQEGPLVRGSLGEDRMMLSGKVAGERLVGTFEDDSGDMGSIDLTPTVDRMSFTGTLRYAGETDAEQWEGTLVSPLARKGIVADPKTLEGVWSTDWGVLVLDADAGSYRGMFSAECVEIQARFSSGVLQGTLFNGTTGEEGSLRLSFDRERKSFTGYYGYGDEEPTPWDGWRLR